MNRITQYLSDIFAFDGRNFDPSLPLQFNQHRHDDPTPGVWLNEEPVGYAGGDENVRPYRVSPSQNSPISVDTDPPSGP
jgi:hypothetical protein